MSTQIKHYYALLKHYAPLTWHSARMTMKNEMMGTMGGFIWWVLDPLFYCVLYYFVFDVILDRGTDNFITFLLLGLVIFRWISIALVQSATSIIQKKQIMRQIDVPKVIFPVEVCIIQLVKFFAAFAPIFGLLILINGVTLSAIYYLPFVILSGFLLTVGGALTLSAIIPFLPDLENVLRMVVQALRYVSVIFFSLDQVPEKYQIFIEINPLALLIISTRDVLMYGTAPSTGYMLYIIGFGLVFSLFGLFLHKKLNRVYPRYVI